MLLCVFATALFITSSSRGTNRGFTKEALQTSRDANQGCARAAVETSRGENNGFIKDALEASRVIYKQGIHKGGLSGIV
jgi:hypothetical protein